MGGLGVVASIGDLYREGIVETGKEAEFLFYVAFLVSFGFIRTSAHMIRAQVSWWPGNVEVGGTHIHHLVWGMIVVLIAGWIGVTQDLGSPWKELTAIAFGIGAGLTMDEFALWLTLRDVYWQEEGRRSIDAVIVVVAVAGILLVGFRGWIDAATNVEDYVFHVVGWSGLIAIGAIAANLAKERFGFALIGVLIPPVALVGAFRLGRPSSLWARWFYSGGKLERARARYAHRSLKPIPPPLDRRLQERRRRRAQGSAAQEGAGSEAGSSGPSDPSAPG